MDLDSQQDKKPQIAASSEAVVPAVAPTTSQQTATAQAGDAATRRMLGLTSTSTAASTATTDSAAPIAGGTVARLVENTKSTTLDANGKPHDFPAGTIVTVIGLVPGTAHRYTVSVQDASGTSLQIDVTQLKVEPNVMTAGPEGPGQIGQAHYGEQHGDLWDPAVGPVPEDARHQGAAGDCYFISSMAAVCAQNPLQIESLFADRPKAGEGPHKTYKVSLYFPADDGTLQKKTIAVDRWVPEANPGNNQSWKAGDPFYDGTNTAASQGGASTAQPGVAATKKPHVFFWAELLEKAFAQLSGSFSAIGNGSLPALGLQALTGVASEQLLAPKYGGTLAPPAGVDAGTYVLQTFQAFQDQSKAVVAGTMAIADGAGNPYGLYSSHAYQFVKIVGSTLIFKNPWGFDDPAPIDASQFLSYFDDVADNAGRIPARPPSASSKT